MRALGECLRHGTEGFDSKNSKGGRFVVDCECECSESVTTPSFPTRNRSVHPRFRGGARHKTEEGSVSPSKQLCESNVTSSNRYIYRGNAQFGNIFAARFRCIFHHLLIPVASSPLTPGFAASANCLCTRITPRHQIQYQ